MHQVLLKSFHRPRKKCIFTSFMKRHILSIENETKKHTSSSPAHQRLNDTPPTPPHEQTATFALYQQASGKLSMWCSAAPKASWSHYWHRLLPSALSHSHTFSPHPVFLWHCKELAQETEMAKPLPSHPKIKSSNNNYCMAQGLMYAYVWKSNTSNLFIFLYFAGSVSQRLLWHWILKQNILHFHIKQF